jgi:hypothetical protein
MPKEARIRFRVRVLVPVRYGGTTFLRKVGYGYDEDICFIKFFIYIIMHILTSICEFKSNYG